MPSTEYAATNILILSRNVPTSTDTAIIAGPHVLCRTGFHTSVHSGITKFSMNTAMNTHI